MPPKIKITKEKIIDTGIALVRQNGAEALNARSIAAFLHCSTQPIFSNFNTIDELKLAILNKADKLSQTYINREIEQNEYPPYKASGMGYIRFAKEEKELFKLLYMRNRLSEEASEENALFDQMINYVQDNTGLTDNTAKLFHLEIWAFVHGIATMLATNYLDLDWALISGMITDAYRGLKQQYLEKE